MRLGALAPVALALVTACGAPPAPSTPPRTPAAGAASPPSLEARKPVAPGVDSPKPDPLLGRAGGVTFRVPVGWTVRNEGAIAVARSEAGDAGFVVGGFADPGDLPIALHRADDEFRVHFPVGLGTQQLGLGRLPYSFLLRQEERPQNGRIARLSVLTGRGPKAETPSLVLLVYVGVSSGPEKEAEGRRHGETFEGIFATFDEDRSGAPAVAAAAPPASASASAPRVEVPVRLTPEEQKTLAGSCKPLLAAFQRSVAASKARGRLGMTLDGMQATLATPPELPAATQSKCLALFERETRAYLIDTVGVEAKVSLGMLARAMKQVVEDGGPGQLCPSSARPVPAKVPDFYTNVPRSTWDEPAWRCLRVDGVISRTSIQLETRTDTAQGTMVLLARGAPFRDGRVVEWTIEGRVQAGRLTYGEVTLVR